MIGPDDNEPQIESIVVPLIVNFDTVEDVPTDPIERRRVDASILHFLEKDWLGRLSKADALALDEHSRNGVTESIEPPDLARRIFDAIDEAIFSQARTLGPKLLLCDIALRRLLKWDSLSNGPELWKRFGREMATHLEVARGKKKHPLDDRMRLFRNDLKTEYVTLKRWLRSENPRRQVIPVDELVSLAKKHADDNPRAFSRLRANWTLFESFTKSYPEWLTQRNLTPAAFADAFLARFTNRKEESLRQAITGMPLPKL